MTLLAANFKEEFAAFKGTQPQSKYIRKKREQGNHTCVEERKKPKELKERETCLLPMYINPKQLHERRACMIAA